MPYNKETFTYELTNDSITLNESHGITKYMVLCTTATPGSMTGSGKLGGLSSTPIPITQDLSINNTASEDRAFTGITFTAPSGCTLLLILE